ncbi:RmlC-like cupin domain-containing protein [Tuber borchii]|uniref:Cysteine dioxygenase n=1 Tax=Tuber borchii TaxID=42251 RepID=A0A2T6ZGT0_TUBBO|nr:RmlC-like cupin domain-containing protein [Tuber borchii]
MVVPDSSLETLEETSMNKCTCSGVCKRKTDFDNLVEKIRLALGPSAGIDSDEANCEHLINLMRRYVSKELEWSKYAFVDATRNYTRNFVDHGNGKANLLVLVWNPGKGSLIHDHADSHCIMKILKGSLVETLFDMPGPNDEAKPLKHKSFTIYGENEVAYISNKIGLHKISNDDPDEIAVSLHLYTPPWCEGEKTGCYYFAPTTGKKTLVNMSNYYSVHGKKS